MTEDIKRLENIFNDLTMQINAAEKNGNGTIELNKERQRVYEEMTRLRREEYEDRFRMDLDDEY
jgi:hypothetical protein